MAVSWGRLRVTGTEGVELEHKILMFGSSRQIRPGFAIAVRVIQGASAVDDVFEFLASPPAVDVLGVLAAPAKPEPCDKPAGAHGLSVVIGDDAALD